MKNEVAARYCPYCGQPAVPAWKHCPACGKQLPATEIDRTGEIPGPESPGSRKDDRLGKAISKLRLGELDRAKEIVSSLLRDIPQDAEALALLGSIYLHQYRIGEAKQYLDRAILLAPDSTFVRLKLAEYWLALGIPSRAFEELTTAEEQAVDDTQLLLYIRSLSRNLRNKTRGNVLLQPAALPGSNVIGVLKGLWRNTPLLIKNKKEVTHEL